MSESDSSHQSSPMQPLQLTGAETKLLRRLFTEAVAKRNIVKAEPNFPVKTVRVTDAIVTTISLTGSSATFEQDVPQTESVSLRPQVVSPASQKPEAAEPLNAPSACCPKDVLDAPNQVTKTVESVAKETVEEKKPADPIKSPGKVMDQVSKWSTKACQT